MSVRRSVADNVSKFIAIVRQRSVENEVALNLMIKASILSQAISIIRQEIDSLVRLRYILSLDLTDRDTVIANFLRGSFRAPNGLTKLTDKDMVSFASRLEGWPKVAYEFGCSFVHLSHLHAYRSQDPLEALEAAQRDKIIEYLCQYHGKPDRFDPSADELLDLMGPVLEKITGNIEYYLEDLASRTPPGQVL